MSSDDENWEQISDLSDEPDVEIDDEGSDHVSAYEPENPRKPLSYSKFVDFVKDRHFGLKTPFIYDHRVQFIKLTTPFLSKPLLVEIPEMYSMNYSGGDSVTLSERSNEKWNAYSIAERQNDAIFYPPDSSNDECKFARLERMRGALRGYTYNLAYVTDGKCIVMRKNQIFTIFTYPEVDTHELIVVVDIDSFHNSAGVIEDDLTKIYSNLLEVNAIVRRIQINELTTLVKTIFKEFKIGISEIEANEKKVAYKLKSRLPLQKKVASSKAKMVQRLEKISQSKKGVISDTYNDIDSSVEKERLRAKLASIEKNQAKVANFVEGTQMYLHQVLSSSDDYISSFGADLVSLLDRVREYKRIVDSISKTIGD